MQVTQTKRVGITAIAFSIYAATIPISQALLVGSGTITKYLGLVVIIAAVIEWIGNRNRFAMIPHKIIRSIVVLFLWCSLTLIWAPKFSMAWSSLVSLTSYLALLVAVSSREWNETEIKLIKIVFIGAVIYYAFLLIQTQYFSLRRRSTFVVDATGKGSDENYLGLALGIAVVFLLEFWYACRRTVFKIGIPVLMFGIIVGVFSTGSRGALIAIVVGVFVFLLGRERSLPIFRRKGFWVMAILIVTVVVFYTRSDLFSEAIVTRYSNDANEASFQWRMQNFWDYMRIAFTKPRILFFGYGKGCESEAYKAFYGSNWPPATHNDISSIICSIGLAGLAAIVSMIIPIWRQSARRKDFLAIAILIVVLIGSLDIDLWMTHIWWFALELAMIGIGTYGENRQIYLC